LDKAWHGGCLALAEMIRRGLLLPSRLSILVPLVCRALHFEQVSGNNFVGQHVRDAACYVCWAFARAYSPAALEPFVGKLADSLLQVAVYDREINCRRAAAAAVQEHVGRQGVFPHGIDVVTLADYWTLSLRRNAYLVVAPQLAVFGSYRRSFINHLVEIKLHHQDLQIRKLSSQALANLVGAQSEETLAYVNGSILPKLVAAALNGHLDTEKTSDSQQSLGKAAQVNVAVRHGAVSALAALVEVMHDKVTVENQNAVRTLVPGLEKARAYRGRGGEVIRQSACNLLAQVAAATAWLFKEATSARYLQTVEECARHSTDMIQVAAADAFKLLAAFRFSEDLNNKCIHSYLAGLRQTDETISARRGFILCLGSTRMSW